MKIAAAQIACTLGDLAANLHKMREFAGRAQEAGADLVVFPEMADTGYAMPTIREDNGAKVPSLSCKRSPTIFPSPSSAAFPRKKATRSTTRKS